MGVTYYRLSSDSKQLSDDQRDTVAHRAYHDLERFIHRHRRSPLDWVESRIDGYLDNWGTTITVKPDDPYTEDEIRLKISLSLDHQPEMRKIGISIWERYQTAFARRDAEWKLD